ncbi:GntR family transcriptional regulator [Diaphorobacter sp. NR2-3-3-1]|nr:GntR family transcriptional regulator [Diaphorobacter caeni]
MDDKIQRSRTEEVHEALRLAILEQGLRPGARLPEDAIGESFGTSRTIAREALGRLAVEGLVELKRNRGAFVAAPDLEEGREILSVRNGLERVVVQTLAGHISTQQQKTLREHVGMEREASSGTTPHRPVRLSGEFHLLLARMTGNQLLSRYITEVVSRCSLVFASHGRPHSSECAVAEHEAIVDALVAGDFEAAALVMQRHLDAVAARTLPPLRAGTDIRDVLARYAAESTDTRKPD